MSAGADVLTGARQPGWWTFLCRELAPAPGRDITTLRMVATVALVTLISMALQVPEAGVSAYMVFFATKENRVLSTVAGVLIVVGITIAIPVSLFLYQYTFDYPVWRVPLMAVVVCVGMYLSRALVLGPLGFAIGFVVALTQSEAENIPDPDALVHALLWVWVALVYPIALTVIVNQVLLPAEPWTAFTRALARRLDAAAKALRRAARNGTVGGGHDAALLDLATRGSAPLLKVLHFAELRDSRLKRRHGSLSAAVTASEALVGAAAALELGERLTLSEGDRSCAQALLAEITGLRTVLPSRVPVPLQARSDGTAAALPELRELALAATAFGDSLARKEPADAAPPKKKQGLFKPDAFTNPAHARFAFKVALAAMSCYVIYTALDWPGIQTAFITCCFIALENTGASTRKGTLRLAGCCVGGLIGFLSILYLIPQMEGIVSLLLLVSAVSALAGWVAAGSERIAYAGLQIALAFYLGIFQGFAPKTDFHALRDRLIGIILGIVVTTVVFRYVWPERTVDALRSVLSRTLRAAARLVLMPGMGTPREAERHEADALRGEIAKDLDDAMHLAELAVLESQVAGGPLGELLPRQLQTAAKRTQGVFLIATVLASEPELDEWDRLAGPEQAGEAALRGRVAEHLQRAATLVENRGRPGSSGPHAERLLPPQEIAGSARQKDRARLLRELAEQTRQLNLLQ